MKKLSLCILWLLSIKLSQAEPLTIFTNDKTYAFDVEIAQSPDELQKGLMNRTSLPKFSGMLFIYPKPQQQSFWMKNTFIPLDIIFIENDGTISSIHPMAKPLSREIIKSESKVRFILEINGGLAQSLDILPGNRVEHRFMAESKSPKAPTN